MDESNSNAADKWLRRKSLSAHNSATMRTDIDTGVNGRLILDEPQRTGDLTPIRLTLTVPTTLIERPIQIEL